jgi:hypothetical protein
MNRLSKPQFALFALLPSLALTALIQACGGSDSAMAQTSAGDRIEGTWESQVTIQDCTSGATLRTFAGMQTFHRGGTVSDTNNAPTATRGPGQGAWALASNGTYTDNFRFYRYNPDGSLAGSQRVQQIITMGADNNANTGTISAEVLDTAGVVLQRVCGTTVGVRLY